MKHSPFYESFVNLLKDLFNAENQIIEALPNVINAATNNDLKKALTEHLGETKHQVQRLKQIFKSLNENPTGMVCKGMQGILKEGEEAIKEKVPGAVKDVNLIIACQKVEHYEMAGYGSARALARHLNDTNVDDRIDFDEIADLLQQTLDEESGADEKLTDLAEGGFFTQGINEEAERATEKPATRKKTAR